MPSVPVDPEAIKTSPTWHTDTPGGTVIFEANICYKKSKAGAGQNIV
jgi:hypothetical protein